MTDLRKTIEPKSDQLNSDDLIGQSRTIKITKVSLLSDVQPIALSFEGDNGKPYKPCKSMRRVLVQVWGGDGNAYVGRSLTIYRDDKVTFGPDTVGGIRISHMSDIDEAITMPLTASRAKRKPFTVQPLKAQEKPPEYELALKEAQKGSPALETWWRANTHYQKLLSPFKDELKKIATQQTGEGQ